MQNVQSVSVHIAVLAVGKDAAPTQTIGELAAQAGHQIVARATVTDTQPAIRAQLQRWIDDANVDVVIVSGGIESENASAALKPLVTQTLPGFTDLFRYLAFQEIGASAMLSNAEAAQCGSTYVFVLPASAGAVKAAMAKLILPQLDSSTTPKNLVTSMPRVRGLSADGIPVAIVKEKTASGSGLTPKQPSKSSASIPLRQRSPTGANVIRTVDDSSFDPPTRPIDVAKLEEQIALSESRPNEAQTRVDLSRLPKRPPGADPVSDDTDQISASGRPARNSRMQSEPIEPPSPSPRRIQRTEPSAVVPPPRAAGKSLLPDPPAPRGPIGLPGSGHAPVAPLPSIAPVPATRTKQPTEPQSAVSRIKSTTGPFAVPAVIPKSPSGPNRRSPTQPPPAPKKSPTEPPPPPRTAAPRAPTTPPPRPPTGANPTVKPEPLPEVAAIVSLPAPPPPRRSPTRPPPSPPPRPPTGQVPTVRQDLGELVSTPLRRSTGEQPASMFTYPAQRGGGISRVALALAGLAVLAVGFVVVLYMFQTKSVTPGPPASKPVVATTPVDATLDVTAEAIPDPEPEFEVVPPPGTHPPSGTHRTPPGGRPPRGGTKLPSTGSAAPAAGSGSNPEPEDTVDNAPNNPPPSADDCDEVACVLAKYDRPCCEKFKPKDSDITPRTTGGLPATLDKSMVRIGMEKVKPRVVACGEKSSEKGTVKVSVTVRPDGTVKDASVVSSPGPALGACVEAAMKKAAFGKSAGGGSFVYPFVF